MKVATVSDGALTIPGGTLLALRAEVLAALLPALADLDTCQSLNHVAAVAVDRVAAFAWNPGRLERCRRLLAAGEKAPPVHLHPAARLYAAARWQLVPVDRVYRFHALCLSFKFCHEFKDRHLIKLLAHQACIRSQAKPLSVCLYPLLSLLSRLLYCFL